MSSKISIYLPIVLIALALLFYAGLSKRRDLPFQEIVPLDQRIAVINAGKWYNNSMTVALFQDGTKKQVKGFNENGACIFENLTNNEPYTIKINRTDIKGVILYKNKKSVITPKANNSKYIVLVGASVGKSWDFPGLIQRIQTDNNIVLGFRTIYDFDKSKEIDILASMPEIVSSVIIKECAAYFPRDLEKSKQDIASWVKTLQSAGIKTALATVVPVTGELDKNAPEKFESIVKFNDFVRQYAERKKLEILDLEKALRISPTDRHLKDEFARADGYHLVPKAYDQELDMLAQSFLKGM